MSQEPQINKKIQRLEDEIIQLEAKISINQSKLEKAKGERDELEEKALLNILKKHKVGHKDLTALLRSMKSTQQEESEPNNQQKEEQTIESSHESSESRGA